MLGRMYGYAMAGDSLFRSYQNEYMRNLRLSGPTLDLGTKSKNAKHLRYFDPITKNNLVMTDAHPSGEDEVLKLDVNQPFPFAEGSFRNVLAINLLEHVYDWSNLTLETRRVLAPGGGFMVWCPSCFPFMVTPMITGAPLLPL